MKRCPVCQSVYSDDSLRFCLQDGAALESASASSDEFKTWVLPEGLPVSNDQAPTEVLDSAADAAIFPRQPSPTAPHKPRDTNPITAQAVAGQPKTRSTTAVVALTIVVTLALIALGGGGAWLLLRDNKATPQRNDNAGNLNATIASNNQNNTQPNANATVSPSPKVTAKPVATPTPSPPPPNPATEEGAVRTALNSWLASFRARDINAYMARYASVLEAYYLGRNVGVARVRGDKERAFAKYTTIEVWLSNVQVQVDTSGQRAVVTFNKSWRFTAPGINPYTGSGGNRFTFKKIGGQWLIVGEQDA